METLMVPLIGVAISLATFIYTVIANARKASVDKVSKLEIQLSDVERRLTECEEDRYELREKVLDLRSRMSAVETPETAVQPM